MTDLRQAAQQALEAMEVLSKLGNGGTDGNSVGNTIAQEAREHLFTALAQPEPTCPECKAAVLYECVACSSNNYPPKPQQEPTQWRDMVVVTLVREGINKHRARELADHFAAQTEPEPVDGTREVFEKWAKSLPNHMDLNRFETGYSDCNTDYAWAGWKAAQRPWAGLIDKDWEHINSRKSTSLDTFTQGAVWAAARLKERNT